MLPIIFYHFGDLFVPPDSDGKNMPVVLELQGKGTFKQLTYACDYWGVCWAYQVDDYPLSIMHNGCCLKKEGLIGDASNGALCWLPYFNNEEDLAVAAKWDIPFEKSFKLFIGNSHSTDHKNCKGLHVYLEANPKELKTGPDNVMDTSMHDWPDFKGEKSSETITLEM